MSRHYVIPPHPHTTTGSNAATVGLSRNPGVALTLLQLIRLSLFTINLPFTTSIPSGDLLLARGKEDAKKI